MQNVKAIELRSPSEASNSVTLVIDCVGDVFGELDMSQRTFCLEESQLDRIVWLVFSGLLGLERGADVADGGICMRLVCSPPQVTFPGFTCCN